HGPRHVVRRRRAGHRRRPPRAPGPVDRLRADESHRSALEQIAAGPRAKMRAQLLFVAVLGLGIARPPAAAAQNPAAQNPAAQNPAPGNPAAALPAVFTPADIAYGARLYDAQCTTCHGANG